jgi:hypothetical protein
VYRTRGIIVSGATYIISAININNYGSGFLAGAGALTGLAAKPLNKGGKRNGREKSKNKICAQSDRLYARWQPEDCAV